MSKFNWSNFDVGFLKSVVYSAKTVESLKPNFVIDDACALTPSMENICNFPSEGFVKKYRDEIEHTLFATNSNLLIKVCNTLNRAKADCTNISESEKVVMLLDLSRKPLGEMLVTAYIKALVEIGQSDYNYEYSSDFLRPISINLSKTEIPKIDLYDFQTLAVSALEKSLIIDNKRAGLLVMPTGSGKTRTAAYFLLCKMIAQGYQIVWLTHRHMLVEQPADAFYKFAGLAKSENPDLKVLNITCVSGMHSNIRKIEKKHNILLLSVQSTVRSLEYLRHGLNKKVIIVVDEAHHAVAASYRKIIEKIQKVRTDTKLLGLTATPLRINEKGTNDLLNFFDNNIIYSVPTAFLISIGVLATPHCERINTNYKVETTIDQEKFIRKWGEASPDLIEKIAHSCERNKIIVDKYIENKDVYGKTLIFAMNVYHCITLCEDFQSRGINCDYVYSGHKGNQSKIKRFQKGELDVLININILSEGSDFPNIQTIFLTRPTSSEVLLLQMIGRGLRGPQAGGTETLNVVDFVDQWDTFTKWLNPKWILAQEELVEFQENESNHSNKSLYHLDWQMCRDIYESITFNINGEPIYDRIIPSGWLSLLDVDGNDVTVLVFEDQLEGFKLLRKECAKLLDPNFSVSDTRKYFKGFSNIPSDYELSLYLADVREDGVAPHIYTFTGRKAIDPIYLSEKIRSENMPILELLNYVKRVYEESEIAQNIFNSFEIYQKRVLDCLQHPKGIFPVGVKNEEMPIERIPFDSTPFYNLQNLVTEVVNDHFNGKFDGVSSFEWTDKCYTRYFGVYYSDSNTIRINKILNSKDIPIEVVKFIIYHEMLHKDNKSHDKQFYIEEHKYPDFEKWNMFLDGQMDNFDLENIWGR